MHVVYSINALQICDPRVVEYEERYTFFVILVLVSYM